VQSGSAVPHIKSMWGSSEIKKLEMFNPEMPVRLTDHNYIMLWVLKTMLFICIKQRFAGFDTSNRNENNDIMALTTQSIQSRLKRAEHSTCVCIK